MNRELLINVMDLLRDLIFGKESDSDFKPKLLKSTKKGNMISVFVDDDKFSVNTDTNAAFINDKSCNKEESIFVGIIVARMRILSKESSLKIEDQSDKVFSMILDKSPEELKIATSSIKIALNDYLKKVSEDTKIISKVAKTSDREFINFLRNSTLIKTPFLIEIIKLL